MSIRFRKRIRLAPGIHLNLSGSGLSLSAGPRGASMTFGGRRGTYMNTGIPGSGLYSRQRIGTSPRSGSSQAGYVGTTAVPITISVEDDGTVVFKDQNGSILDERLVKQAKQQAKDEIQGLLQRACDEINGHIEALEQIHFQTPSPNERHLYTPKPFETPKPAQPVPRKHGFMGMLFRPVRDRIDKENDEAQAAYRAQTILWNRQLQQHDATEAANKALVEEKVMTELPAMETVLEESLMDIVWPRETSVSSEIRDGGRVVMIDVDLPEIEDLPRKTASVPSRGNKLSIKELPVTRLQQLYMRHVHGVGFRIIGEAFYVLPGADEVVLSGYTQRPDKATGEVRDQYLYSVRVKRAEWATVNFANLKDVDPAEALGRFDIRRDVSKTGLFKEITPFDEATGA